MGGGAGEEMQEPSEDAGDDQSGEDDRPEGQRHVPVQRGSGDQLLLHSQGLLPDVPQGL